MTDTRLAVLAKHGIGSDDGISQLTTIDRVTQGADLNAFLGRLKPATPLEVHEVLRVAFGSDAVRAAYALLKDSEEKR